MKRNIKTYYLTHFGKFHHLSLKELDEIFNAQWPLAELPDILFEIPSDPIDSLTEVLQKQALHSKLERTLEHSKN